MNNNESCGAKSFLSLQCPINTSSIVPLTQMATEFKKLRRGEVKRANEYSGNHNARVSGGEWGDFLPPTQLSL